MNYRIVIHSIDQQDREGFLGFLRSYAQRGYEADHVFRSFTVFRKTETPPQTYSMRFDPEGTFRKRCGSIPGLKNGVEIFPFSGEDIWKTGWAKAVSTHYRAFVPYDLSLAFVIAIRHIALPLAMLALLLLSGSGLLESFSIEAAEILPWAVVCVLWAVTEIAREVLVFYMDTLHLRGLKREVEAGQPYEIPPSRQGLVRVKNFCLMIDFVPSVLLAIVLLVKLL